MLHSMSWKCILLLTSWTILTCFDLRTKSDTPLDLHYLELIYMQYEADLMDGSEEVFQNTPKKCDVTITRNIFSHHKGALCKLPLWSCGNVCIHLTHIPEGLFGLENIPSGTAAL